MENETTTSPMTFKIPAYNMDALRGRLDSMNRRAAKLGSAPIEMRELETVSEKEYRPCPLSPEIGTEPTGRMLKFVMVEVVGEAPVNKGWTQVGTLDIIPEVGNLLRLVPGETVPVEYRTAAGRCDHCKASRNRIAHHVVRNEAGEFRMVGSTCIKDFLGGDSVDKVIGELARWGALGELMGAAEEDGFMGGGSRRGRFIDLVAFLGLAAECIAQFGWTSRGAARDSVTLTATADDALDAMFPDPKEKFEDRIVVSAESVALAEKALDWALALDDSAKENDYLYNVSVIARCEALPMKGVGIAASIISAYKRTMEQEAAREYDRVTSAHFGAVKKREVFVLKVLGITTLEGDYGTTFLHRMVDESGNKATWFSSSVVLEEGVFLQVKATVKKHDEFKGVKQTVLSRCAVVEEKK